MTGSVDKFATGPRMLQQRGCGAAAATASSSTASSSSSSTSSSNMFPQQYCLRWRYHHSNLQTMFSQLLERQAFCDVTLACEGKTLRVHKVSLASMTSSSRGDALPLSRSFRPLTDREIRRDRDTCSPAVEEARASQKMYLIKYTEKNF